MSDGFCGAIHQGGKNGYAWALGFHGPESKCPAVDPNTPKDSFKGITWTNLTNFMGWIPGLSIISAVFHAYKGYQVSQIAKTLPEEQKPQWEEFSRGLFLRAAAEASCIGSIALWVLDIGITLQRSK